MLASVVSGPSMSVDQQWRYVSDKIDDLRESNDRQFKELREEQKADRHALRGEMQQIVGRVSGEMQSIRDRVLTVEIERKSEIGLSTKRAGWIAVAVSLLGAFVLRLLEKWWK